MSTDKKSPTSSIEPANTLEHRELQRCQQKLTTRLQAFESSLSSPHNHLNAWMDAEPILKNIAANIEEAQEHPSKFRRRINNCR